MKLTLRQLKKIIKEEVTSYRSDSDRPAQHWLDKDGEITDKCPMCGGEEQEHVASGCDYEQCGYCGFDHSYEYQSAHDWHTENDPEGDLYK